MTSLWSDSDPHARHPELYATEYAKQLERIARIRNEVSAALPVAEPHDKPRLEPPATPHRARPAPAALSRWDAAPADFAAALDPIPRGRTAVAAQTRPPRPPAAARGGRGADAARAGGRRRARRPRALVGVAGVALVAVGALLLAQQGADGPRMVTFHVPGKPTGLVVASDRVWVAGPSAGSVWILDAASGRPAAPPLRTGGTPARIALDSRWAWIADTQRGAVIRAERTGASAGPPIASGPDVTDVAVAGGAVWTASSADGTVRVLDSRGRRRVLHVGARPLALAADERRVVAADAGAGRSSGSRQPRAVLRRRPCSLAARPSTSRSPATARGLPTRPPARCGA